jgi:hypothetical protein
LAHNAQQSIGGLSVSGSPPPSFESIRQRLTRRQEATAGSGVDYIFDIPVEVAAAICKYRYGRLKFDGVHRNLLGSTFAEGQKRSFRGAAECWGDFEWVVERVGPMAIEIKVLGSNDAGVLMNVAPGVLALAAQSRVLPDSRRIAAQQRTAGPGQLRALALQQKSRRGFTCRHNPTLGWSWRSDTIRNRRLLDCSRFGDFIYARNSVGCSVVYPGARQKRS